MEEIHFQLNDAARKKLSVSPVGIISNEGLSMLNEVRLTPKPP